MTSNGEAYGPIRYKQIVQECYIISHQINTSFSDVQEITPLEREYIIDFILDEQNRKKEAIEKAKQNMEQQSSEYKMRSRR